MQVKREQRTRWTSHKEERETEGARIANVPHFLLRLEELKLDFLVGSRLNLGASAEQEIIISLIFFSVRRK